MVRDQPHVAEYSDLRFATWDLGYHLRDELPDSQAEERIRMIRCLRNQYLGVVNMSGFHRDDQHATKPTSMSCSAISTPNEPCSARRTLSHVNTTPESTAVLESAAEMRGRMSSSAGMSGILPRSPP